MEYIDALSGPKGDCFLCRYRDQADQDGKNYVLWRGKAVFAVLNRYPYTGGHTMVAPYGHVAGLGDLDSPTLVEMMRMVRDLPAIMTKALRAEGFNIGINIGRCAGAGLPGHLHIHVVPRWGGDTNFMPVFGDVRVIPQTLDELYRLMLAAGKELNLPAGA
ncbi:MAG: HIT domain-containing protein [Planctomycetes bacterium]|nr:HIT domain-containing protein [Planctomycetota bacterium]